jgi:nitrous oxide reductase
MPSNDPQSAQNEGLSRRSIIRGAATAGAAGFAVTALGGALAPAAGASTRTPASTRSASVPASVPADVHVDTPIVVHVRNAKSGDIELFSGTSQTRLNDKDLAARIARALG